MKKLWNKKYALMAFYAFLVLAAAILFKTSISGFGAVCGFIGKFVGILKSFIIGFVIAYLLNPVYTFFREKVFEKIFARSKLKKKYQLTKALSVLVTYIIALGIFTVLLWIVIPQVFNSIVTCVNSVIDNYDKYYNSANKLITHLTGGSKGVSDLVKTLSNGGLDYLKKLKVSDVLQITNFTFSIASNLFATVIGIIISIYMLYNKTMFCAQIKKTAFALLPNKFVYNIQRFLNRFHSAFGQYITGVLIDALIVGTLTAIFSIIIGSEYAALIGVIVGLTNMIPFFGPYIGGVPAVLLTLSVSPMKALYMAIWLVVLQQIDGNLISPKIVGDKTGLSAIWIIFSILVGGGFFGIIGMLLSVPVFSVFYFFIRDFIAQRLEKKKMSSDTADYLKSADTDDKYKYKNEDNKS